MSSRTVVIKIAAAASLKNGLPQAITQFEHDYPNIKIDTPITYGGSINLAGQIASGAITPDVFLAASKDALDNAGAKVDKNTKAPFIANSLVLIKNAIWMTNNSSLPPIYGFEDVNIHNFTSQAYPSTHVWIANPVTAPAGEYAKDAFLSIPDQVITPTTNLWGSFVNTKTAGTRGSDVQVTLSELINDPTASLGVVYRSDYKNLPSTPLSNAFFVNYAPQLTNAKTIYYAAALKNTAGGIKLEAADFVSFLVDTPSYFITKGFRPVDSLAPSPGDPI